jgi:hypothetical protein
VLIGLLGPPWNIKLRAQVTRVSPIQAKLSPVEKKLKFELLSKHGSNELPLTREIQQYRCLTVQTGDPLAWWKTQAETYPRLTALARNVLAIPATSTPAERVFFHCRQLDWPQKD